MLKISLQTSLYMRTSSSIKAWIYIVKHVLYMRAFIFYYFCKM